MFGLLQLFQKQLTTSTTSKGGDGSPPLSARIVYIVFSSACWMKPRKAE